LRLRVLQIPFCFAPDPIGGTEVYVDGLARALADHDVESIVCAPAQASSAYEHRGLRVRRYAIGDGTDLEDAYGTPSARATREFEAILAIEKPDVVHLHARTRGANATLLHAARAVGAKTVFTYHTPTVSCVRGTMMRWGVEPCDGRLDVARCAACLLTTQGVPRRIAEAIGHVPIPVGRLLARAGRRGGPWTALRMSALVDGLATSIQSLLDASDHIVAVCEWVADVLRRNDVPAKKLSVCRQGLWGSPPAIDRATERGRSIADRPLRLAYFGRLDATKGVDLIVEALRRSPRAPVTLDLYGVAQGSDGERMLASLRAEAAADPRLSICAPVTHDRVVETIARYDLLTVPSRWLETGPLVVLEAFAAKVPVLGMRRGGIAELVRHDVDGWLVDGDDPSLWTAAVARLVDDRASIDRWSSAIRPPRTMGDVAVEMASIYRSK
jgi:glycosyltransferase involved in cell wall biosynthesis